MSDNHEPHVGMRQTLTASWWPVWALLRGLAIGALSAATAAGVAFAIVELAPADTSPCDSDLACLPDVGPLIWAVTSIPVDSS
jgi:hypothetical protein